jgi:hypothetical protein
MLKFSPTARFLELLFRRGEDDKLDSMTWNLDAHLERTSISALKAVAISSFAHFEIPVAPSVNRINRHNYTCDQVDARVTADL